MCYHRSPGSESPFTFVRGESQARHIFESPVLTHGLEIKKTHGNLPGSIIAVYLHPTASMKTKWMVSGDAPHRSAKKNEPEKPTK
jgi:hypothetical protein